MEYEKHIKRLVLGYLKHECKQAYKIFLKTCFLKQQKHIPTRVAGQTLEDILKAYSQIHDIVQGHLEDTNYYKDHREEISPIYLPEQLLYLLEHDRPLSPTSTIRDRSSVVRSIAETQPDQDEPESHSDIETTPEYSLPGNLPSSDDNSNCKTPFRKTSPVFRTPYLEKVAASEHQSISTAMSKKLLKNKDFPKKLAQSINMVLNTPERSTCQKQCDNNKTLDEAVIKDVLHRTEADPMFEDLLNEFFVGSVGNTIEKVIAPEVAVSSSSSTRTESPSPFKSFPSTHGRSSASCYSEFSLSNNQLTNQNKSSEYLEETSGPTNQNACNSISQTEESTAQPNSTEIQIHSQYICPPSTVFPTTSTSACSTQTDIVQQQFYIVNQPVVIPQPMQVLPVQSFKQPLMVEMVQTPCSNSSSGRLSEQEIMAMPTIFLNERNEITYADPELLKGANRKKEVQSIKEYLNVYGESDQSPVIKIPTKKNANVEVRPTPTIKVEIFQRNSPLRPQISPSLPGLTELPDLSESCFVEAAKTSSSKVKELASTSDGMPSDQRTRSRSLNAACTPPPVVTTGKKPTPKSSSHVRNLTFPSPIRKTNEKTDDSRKSPSAANKQQAVKDLFNKKKSEAEHDREENKVEKKVSNKPKKTKSSRTVKSPPKRASPRKGINKTSPIKLLKQPGLWDADLRVLVPPSPSHEVQDTPSRRASRKRKKRSDGESQLLEAEAKILENALKTPGKNLGKTPSRRKKTKSNNSLKQTTDVKSTKAIDEVSVETKKVLSPSKLCNAASKRNMEVDGITPNNPREGSCQLVSNARKNITSLLETPLKETVETPSVKLIEEEPGTGSTPFTPMLKANLEGYAVGDNFTIDTPNFPVTPGISMMETTTTNYCILNDTETNKVTEAIVLSEEKKSSVRKTDDEEVVLSPKVYGCKEVLGDFNKSQTGKKNLELLDKKGVHWDGASDKEDKSEGTSSESNEESNNTVIRNTSANVSSRVTRCSGKTMALLKSQLLDSSRDKSVCFEDTFDGDDEKEPPSSPKNTVNRPSPPEENSKTTKSITPASSNDSEIVSKECYKKRVCKAFGGPNETVDKDPCSSTTQLVTANALGSDDDTRGKLPITPGSNLKLDASLDSEKLPSCLSSKFNYKDEMEEKRKRIIQLEKVMNAQKSRTPGRRKNSSSKSDSSSSKRKKTAPKKLIKRRDMSSDDEKVDSQDEFFKQSGTNLHRTHKQIRVSERIRAKRMEYQAEESGSDDEKSDKVTRKEVQGEIKKISSDQDGSRKTLKESQSETEEDKSFWDELASELQPEEILVEYNPEKASKKSLKDYDMQLDNKVIRLYLPLADGSEQNVDLSVTPYRMLWEILPSGGAKEAARTSMDNCSDSDSVRIADPSKQKCARKRKHRSDSSNSNSSTKKMKNSLIPVLTETTIETVLSKLHGPSGKK